MRTYISPKLGSVPLAELKTARLPKESVSQRLTRAAATTTTTGLTIQAADDPNWSPTGVTISDAELATVPLIRHEWHGDWNHTITAHSVAA